MDSGEAQQNQMMQYLNSKELQAGFQRVGFNMIQVMSGQGLRQSGTFLLAFSSHIRIAWSNLGLSVPALK